MVIFHSYVSVYQRVPKKGSHKTWNSRAVYKMIYSCGQGILFWDFWLFEGHSVRHGGLPGKFPSKMEEMEVLICLYMGKWSNKTEDFPANHVWLLITKIYDVSQAQCIMWSKQPINSEEVSFCPSWDDSINSQVLPWNLYGNVPPIKIDVPTTNFPKICKNNQNHHNHRFITVAFIPLFILNKL